MKRITVCLALALVAGCENSNDPIGGIGGGGGTGAITAVQASGAWTVTLRRSGPLQCSAGSLPDNQVLTLLLDVRSNGTLTTSTSSWRNPPSTNVRALDGSVTFTDGLANLLLYPSGTPTQQHMELRGTLTAGGAFTGTLSDPAPGALPVFSSSGCEYTATGTKTG